MKSYIDHNKLQKRGVIANTASVGGMLVMMASVVFNLFVPGMETLGVILMIAGMLAALLGIFFANRWIKKPRPEAVLDDTLKSLTDPYQIYHYPSLPCEHILLTPYGVWAIETVNLEGEFTLEKGKWQEKITIGRAIRWIVEEHLGDPLKEAGLLAENLQQHLAPALPAGTSLTVWPLVVFINPRARAWLKDGNVPVVMADKLKKHVVGGGSAKLAPEVYQAVQTALDATLPPIETQRSS